MPTFSPTWRKFILLLTAALSLLLAPPPPVLSSSGPYLVKDIHPTSGSVPGSLSPTDKWLYFSADDGTGTLRGLWRTDGTAKRTKKLSHALLGSMIQLGVKTLFCGFDYAHGAELWVTRGKRKGTQLLKDIWPGRHSGGCGYWARFRDSVFYCANLSSQQTALWKSDGTEAGTVQVKELLGSSCGPHFVYNNALYLHAQGLLWQSDGTEAGTAPFRPDLQIGSSAVAGGKLFLLADDGVHGSELWVSDGTANGTTIIEDINPNGDLTTTWLIPARNLLYLLADDGVHGSELWVSDGTAVGTKLIEGITLDGGSIQPWLTTMGNKLFFIALDSSERKLWKADGAQATALAELPRAQIDFMTRRGQDVLLVTFDRASRVWLWKSDGSPEGTVRVKKLSDKRLNRTPGQSQGNLNAVRQEYGLWQVPQIHDTIYFPLLGDTGGIELWQSDGTPEGSHLTADIYPGGSSYPADFAVWKGGLYFNATDAIHSRELWAYLP